MIERPGREDETELTAGDAAHAAPAPERPAEHALLGLLKLAGGTAHGYDLARQFRRGAPLGDVIHLEPAMLYKHLKKLARLGWLTMSLVDQSPRPPRQVCRLSAAGEAELQRWLAEPVARTREIRLEFLVKLYFALQLEPDLAVRLVEHQREIATRTIGAFERRLDLAAGSSIAEPSPAERSMGTAFHTLVVELRLAQTQAAVKWLEHVSQEFGGQQGNGVPTQPVRHEMNSG